MAHPNLNRIILLLSQELPRAAAIDGLTEGVEIQMIEPDLPPADLAATIGGFCGNASGVVASFGPRSDGGRFLAGARSYAKEVFGHLKTGDVPTVFCEDGANETLWHAIGFCRGVALAEETCAPFLPRVFIAKGLARPEQI